MKKIKWFLGLLLLALVPMLQSCDDNDGYSIGDFSWDWATVHTTGGGGYYLEGDRWGTIDPVSTSIPSSIVLTAYIWNCLFFTASIISSDSCKLFTFLDRYHNSL